MGQIEGINQGADPGVNLTGAKGMWRQSRHRAGGAGDEAPERHGGPKIFWGPRPLNLLNT